MGNLELLAERLRLRPLPAGVAAMIPEDRAGAGRALGAALCAEWPDSHLLGPLERQAGLSAGSECFGIWVMIEREGGNVVGDVGFHGPPDQAGAIEIGYSVIPGRRGRGYAAEAAGALVAWALSQPGVQTVVAGCLPDNVASARTLERAGFRRTGARDGETRWRYEASSAVCERQGLPGARDAGVTPRRVAR
jgi:RimJ/RimL family protein N-acetyltransferase